MVTRRITQEDDADRLAERVYNYTNGNIKDRNGFDQAFNDYMGEINQKQDTKLRKEVFDRMTSKHSGIIRERFKATRKPVQAGKKTNIFNVLASTRGKVVYAHRTYVKVRGKRQVRLRDKLGRFAKAK